MTVIARTSSPAHPVPSAIPVGALRGGDGSEGGGTSPPCVDGVSCRKHLVARSKIDIATTALWSILFYNASSWPVLPASVRRRPRTAYMPPIRSSAGVTHAVRQTLLPRPSCSLPHTHHPATHARVVDFIRESRLVVAPTHHSRLRSHSRSRRLRTAINAVPLSPLISPSSCAPSLPSTSEARSTHGTGYTCCAPRR